MSLLIGMDAIKLKNVSKSTLYRNIKKGKLKVYKNGHDWYVYANDYESYITSTQIETKLELFKPNHLNRLVSIMNNSLNSLEDEDKFIRRLLDEVKVD